MEEESDSPKANAGCKRQEAIPQKFKNPNVCSQPTWLKGAGVVLQAEEWRRHFLCGGLQGGKRGTDNSDPF